MCLFIILLAFGPRTAIAIWWLVEPVRWSATFGSFFGNGRKVSAMRNAPSPMAKLVR